MLEFMPPPPPVARGPVCWNPSQKNMQNVIRMHFYSTRFVIQTFVLFCWTRFHQLPKRHGSHPHEETDLIRLACAGQWLASLLSPIATTLYYRRIVSYDVLCVLSKDTTLTLIIPS
jgi:hypothetical protein